MTIDEPAHSIVPYVRAASQALKILTGLHATEITAIDVQQALCERLQIDESDPYPLLEMNLSTESIIDILRDFDFSQYHPEVLAEVELEEGLLPAGVPRLLREQTVKIRGEIWQIHKYDADPFPSVPHAHNYETGCKLDLGTGELFNKNRKSVGRIKKQSLIALWERLNGLTLPNLAV